MKMLIRLFIFCIVFIAVLSIENSKKKKSKKYNIDFYDKNTKNDEYFSLNQYKKNNELKNEANYKNSAQYNNNAKYRDNATYTKIKEYKENDEYGTEEEYKYGAKYKYSNTDNDSDYNKSNKHKNSKIYKNGISYKSGFDNNGDSDNKGIPYNNVGFDSEPNNKGAFSDWSSWSDCSATCAGGTTSRRRKCQQIYSKKKGKAQCIGLSIEKKQCNEDISCYETIEDELPIEPMTKSVKIYPESQPSILTNLKKHALFIWIYINFSKYSHKCLLAAANLQQYVDQISDSASSNYSNTILAGVGFGNYFYSSMINRTTEKNFVLHERKNSIGGVLPSTGGDIFIHAKSDNYSNLYELNILIRDQLNGCIKIAEDIITFAFRGNRDLNGFVDGVANPTEFEKRQLIAIEPSTGGSYVLTQKWVHNFEFIRACPVSKLEEIIGRNLVNSSELQNKPQTSHIARMVGGNEFEQVPKFEVYRQSMPFGNVYGDAGLFYMAHAASVDNHNFMLDRMAGVGENIFDDLMLTSTCKSGNYWYFPGVRELKNIVSDILDKK